jgi:hypothetical protein
MAILLFHSRLKYSKQTSIICKKIGYFLCLLAFLSIKKMKVLKQSLAVSLSWFRFMSTRHMNDQLKQGYERREPLLGREVSTKSMVTGSSHGTYDLVHLKQFQGHQSRTACASHT